MKKTALLILIILALVYGSALAQASAFTYQGKLTDGGTPANGQYDLQFRLFDAPAGGSQVGTPVTVEDVQVTAGIFTVSLDFGAAPFTSFSGGTLYLLIMVRSGASTGTYTPLLPLQQLTSSPYSIAAIKAATAIQADNSSSVPFSGVTTGTNTVALTVGTGGSLSATGTGTIAATSAPASGLTGTTLAANVTGSSLTSIGTLTGLTVNGATNINNSNNGATNIGTGTSIGAVTIGGGANTVAINSSTWDISSSGNASGLTSITASGVLSLNNGTNTISSVELNLLDGEVSPLANDTDITNHAALTTGVHGVGAGAVVGTTLSQTLSNKTLTSPVIRTSATFETATAADDRVVIQPTAGGPARFDGTITAADLSGARTWTLPNVTGTVITTGNLSSITSVGTLSSLNVGGGSTIQSVLSATAALDFPGTAAQSSSDQTITLTGAADGDSVALGIPNASVLGNSSYTAWVSSADTVTVRFNNYSAGLLNPGSGTFRVTVIRF